MTQRLTARAVGATALAATLALGSLLVAGTPPAGASPSVVPLPSLSWDGSTLHGTGVADLTVSCDATKVRAQTGDVQVAITGASVDGVPCASVQAIDLAGTSGDDTVRLDSLTIADFPVLATTVFDGGDGADTLYPSFASDTFTGGPGDDTLQVAANAPQPNDADDHFDGGADTDTVAITPQTVPVPPLPSDGTYELGANDDDPGTFLLERTDPEPFTLHLASVEAVTVADSATHDHWTVHPRPDLSVTLSDQGPDPDDVLVDTYGRDYGVAGGGPGVVVVVDDTGPVDIADAANTSVLDLRVPDFVDNAYLSLLGRYPTDVEYRFSLSALLTGTPRSTLAWSLLHSSAYRQRFANDLYNEVFGRDGDLAGIAYWSTQLAGGLSPDVVRAAFYGSAEYFSAAGGTNSAYVDALYQDVLGRPADSAGHTYWTGLLSSGTPRTTMAYSFEVAPETVAIRVVGYYQYFLDRDCSPAEFGYWTGIYLKVGEYTVIQSLVASAEFFQHGHEAPRRLDGTPRPPRPAPPRL